MSEPKKRKVHTPEYKAKVALEALRSGKTINQISQEFDVHPVQVGLWKKTILRGLPARGAAQLWQARDIQQQSGLAVHQRRLHRCTQARRDQDQQGRAWSRL